MGEGKTEVRVARSHDARRTGQTHVMDGHIVALVQIHVERLISRHVKIAIKVKKSDAGPTDAIVTHLQPLARICAMDGGMARRPVIKHGDPCSIIDLGTAQRYRVRRQLEGCVHIGITRTHYRTKCKGLGTHDGSCTQTEEGKPKGPHLHEQVSRTGFKKPPENNECA